MATAAGLRAEAAGMREFARTATDPEVLAEINLLIAEWEQRARGMGDGVDNRTTALIAYNRELLATAAEAREWAQEAIAQAEHAVRDVVRARIARELSRSAPVPTPIDGARGDLRDTAPPTGSKSTRPAVNSFNTLRPVKSAGRIPSDRLPDSGD